MNNEKIELLLERIALALERLVEQVKHLGTVSETPIGRRQTKEGKGHISSVISGSGSPALIEQYLNSKGIRIKTIPPEDPADQVIDRLALFLGEHYHVLSDLLSKIKRAMQYGDSIKLSLKDYPKQDISYICQFCSDLLEVAFLEKYHYFRSPKYLLFAKTTTLSKAQRFFGGQWLERFILQKVRAVYAKVTEDIGEELRFECLVNPQIMLPNGEDFELDVLAAIGEQIYWIEAKSSDYQKHVPKYSKFASRLGLDSNHCFLVLTDVSDDRCHPLSSLFSMSVCTLRAFEDKLLAVVRADVAPRDGVTVT